MKNYDAILFDFDFTLVDSSQGIVLCAQHAFDRMGFDVDDQAIIDAIGMPLPEKYHHITGDNEASAGAHFMQLFMQKQPELMTDNTSLFAEVPAMLQQLNSHGHAVGIVSTKTTEPIYELLHRESLAEHFHCVVGGEHVTRHKPDPEGIHIAMKDLNVPHERVLFVGDSIYDAGAAEQAGVDFVATLSGRTPASAFDAYPCLAVVGSLSELHDATARASKIVIS